MRLKHRFPECVGKWLFKENATMGVTFITCSRCGAGTADADGAIAENQAGVLLAKLTEEGQKFLRKEGNGSG
jgi:hypothetical protein